MSDMAKADMEMLKDAKESVVELGSLLLEIYSELGVSMLPSLAANGEAVDAIRRLRDGSDSSIDDRCIALEQELKYVKGNLSTTINNYAQGQSKMERVMAWNDELRRDNAALADSVRYWRHQMRECIDFLDRFDGGSRASSGMLEYPQPDGVPEPATEVTDWMTARLNGVENESGRKSCPEMEEQDRWGLAADAIDALADAVDCSMRGVSPVQKATEARKAANRIRGNDGDAV